MNSTNIFLGLTCQSVCVAKTCSTSLVPIPKAIAPKAPWVAVWLSPQTINLPGCVRPVSGPTICTIPCLSEPCGALSIPNSMTFSASLSICALEITSLISKIFTVGTLWSKVPKVRSGRLTLRPASRRP